MAVKITFTRRQEKLLRRHLTAIRTASRVGQRGVFVAQIRKDIWDEHAYVIAHFYPGALCEPIMNAVREARTPHLWCGLPEGKPTDGGK